MIFKKTILLSLVLLLLAVPVMAAEETTNEGTGNEEPEIAAIVNGDKITVSEVDQYIGLNSLMQKLFQTDQQFVQILFSTEAGEAFLNEYRKAKMEGLIVQKILADEAKNRDLSLNEEEKEEFFKKQLEQIKKQNNMTEEDLLNALKQQGIESIEGFKKVFFEQNGDAILISELQKQVFDPVTVEEKEVTEYYEENKDEYTHKDEVRASHILFDEKEKAEDILTKLKEGADFTEMAKEHSTGPSGSKGGDVGFFDMDSSMAKPFKDAAFKLEIGEISDVVKSEFGYHIIKVTDKNPAGTTPFEDVKEEIKENLENEKKQDVWSNFVEELREKAKIEYKL